MKEKPLTSKPMKTLKQFAETYRLKIKPDSCGDQIIPGKPRKADKHEDKNHIYDHGDGQFGLYINFTSASSSAKWTYSRARLLESGFKSWQDGDFDGIVLFNPSNKKQARHAIKEAGARIKRVLSPEERDRLVQTLRLNRSDPL